MFCERYFRFYAFLLSSVFLPVVSSLPAQADGLFYQLPADGASATYALTLKLKADARQMDITGTMKMSSVGRTMVDGEPGRWIEIATFNSAEKKTRYVKIHVLEKHLQRQFKPIHHLIEVWSQSGKKPRKQDPNRINGEFESVAIYMAEELHDGKKLPAIEVESCLGKLLCTGHSGHISFQTGSRTNDVNYVSRIHRSAPFGYVAGTVSVKRHTDGEVKEEMNFTFKLIETADDAKSEVDHDAVDD